MKTGTGDVTRILVPCPLTLHSILFIQQHGLHVRRIRRETLGGTGEDWGQGQPTFRQKSFLHEIPVDTTMPQREQHRHTLHRKLLISEILKREVKP